VGAKKVPPPNQDEEKVAKKNGQNSIMQEGTSLAPEKVGTKKTNPKEKRERSIAQTLILQTLWEKRRDQSSRRFAEGCRL